MVIGENPLLRRNVRAVEDILRHATVPIPDTLLECSAEQSVPNFVFGNGAIDALDAVMRARAYPFNCPLQPRQGCETVVETAQINIRNDISQEVGTRRLAFDFSVLRGTRNRNMFANPIADTDEHFTFW